MILFLRLAKPLPFAVYADFADTRNRENLNNNGPFMVPVERIELPTFGLQNRWAGVTTLVVLKVLPWGLEMSHALLPAIDYLANAFGRDEKLGGQG
jgi:hypothetical protein